MPDSRDIASRMKMYEKLTASTLMPLLPAMARLDGKAFHAFTKGLPRPFDERLTALMVQTTKWLMEETSAIVGYTQSDEISLIWLGQDYKTQMVFGGRVQKLTSVLAALCSVYFNKQLPNFIPEKTDRLPVFDCRVWNVPTKGEAANCLIWRQQDAARNSISMASQAVYSHNQLMNKNCSEMHEMLFARGINWNNYPGFFKNGTLLRRRKITRPFTTSEIEKLPPKHEARRNQELMIERNEIQTSFAILTKVTNRVEFLFDEEEPIASGA